MGLLQETHLNEKEHKNFKREWVGQVFSASYESEKERGVVILCHKSLCLVLERVYEDKKGHHVMVVGTVGDISITIMNLYATIEDDPSFFKEIASLLAEYSKENNGNGWRFQLCGEPKCRQIPT